VLQEARSLQRFIPIATSGEGEHDLLIGGTGKLLPQLSLALRVRLWR